MVPGYHSSRRLKPSSKLHRRYHDIMPEPMISIEPPPLEPDIPHDNVDSVMADNDDHPSVSPQSSAESQEGNPM